MIRLLDRASRVVLRHSSDVGAEAQATSPSLAMLVLLCTMLGGCSERIGSDPSQPDDAGAGNAVPDRPNIVLMVVEDLSPRIGAFGDPVAVTPNLDQLAGGGIRYTNVFTTAGVCAPSRAALTTGMYQQAIGAQHMRTSSFGRSQSGPLGTVSTAGPAYESVPPPYVKAFPEYLRAAGYTTINNVKSDYQFGNPFSIWDANSPDASIADREPGKPFFLMLSNGLTHESGMFRPDTTSGLDGAAERAAENAERWATLDVRTDPDTVVVPAFLPDTAATRKDLALHYDNIRSMDQWVGSVLEALRRDNLLDDTIVIWTTDHGDGIPRAKRSLYDSGLHVPMIVRFPDSRGAGSTDEQLISFVDLAPTILGLAGVDAPEHMHGRDFYDPGSRPRKYVHAARDRLDEIPDRSRAVRSREYKYIRNYVPDRPFFAALYYRENLAAMKELRRLATAGELAPELDMYFRTPRPDEELYFLPADHEQLDNVATKPAHAEALEEMRAELERWLARVGDWSEIPEREMVLTRMWPAGEQPQTAEPKFDYRCGTEGNRLKIRSQTEGASIGYRIDDSLPKRWQLYVAPIHIPEGAKVKAKAIRYGYSESPPRSLVLDCQKESS